MIAFVLAILGQLGELLTNRITATRAANLDKLDANISTRAAASTALSTAIWDGTKAGYLDAAVTSRLKLVSIQYGTVTIASGATSGTATLSPTVTAANTLLIYLGADRIDAAARITLTSGTTVTANRATAPATALTVSFAAVEFG